MHSLLCDEQEILRTNDNYERTEQTTVYNYKMKVHHHPVDCSVEMFFNPVDYSIALRRAP